MTRRTHIAILSLVFLAVTQMLLACGTATGMPTGSPIAPAAVARVSPTSTLINPVDTPVKPSLVSPSPTPSPSLWIASYLPDSIRQAIHLPPGTSLADQPENANLRLEVSGENPLSRWIYVLVAPFPTITDGVAYTDLLSLWNGKKAGPFSGLPLLMDESTLQVLSAWLGEPAPGSIKVVPAGQLLQTAWENRPSWAIVPFETLEPRWKVLEVDGQSPVHKEFDVQSYPLSVPISLNGDLSLKDVIRPVELTLPASNRNENEMTTVVMTGVTALVRGTSNLMYLHGVTYPDQDIGPILRSADITHISNEIPFAKNCPLYNPEQNNLVFCTATDYIKLLEDVGTKVVEVTGDHFIDWGPEATLYTLDLYKERGWQYYGGGANLSEGQLPAKFEHNGNRIAFIGCNAKGGGYATASDVNPGAAACDYEKLHQEIQDLRQEGYQVIATFQHQEYYSYKVKPQYRPDFTGMVDAGAVIVQGSEAHQPHNFEFYEDGFIHYGLGNLFFDQYNFFPETNDAFIDRHIFYAGRYISTELIPIRFVDMARSRPMTADERALFLDVIFKASGW